MNVSLPPNGFTWTTGDGQEISDILDYRFPEPTRFLVQFVEVAENEVGQRIYGDCYEMIVTVQSNCFTGREALNYVNDNYPLREAISANPADTLGGYWPAIAYAYWQDIE